MLAGVGWVNAELFRARRPVEMRFVFACRTYGGGDLFMEVAAASPPPVFRDRPTTSNPTSIWFQLPANAEESLLCSLNIS
jgi:hypothetical protein